MVIKPEGALFPLQPPPQIYDKQLDEREHSIDEWKGKTCFSYSVNTNSNRKSAISV